MTPGMWLSADGLANLSRVTRRAATKTLSRAHEGKTWRGHRLAVRRVRGPGGNSGWSYEVRVDSLPAELQAALRADLSLFAEDTSAPAEVDDPGDIARWRYEVIEPALNHPAASCARGRAMVEASRMVRTYPSGRRGRVSVRTVRRWVSAYERSGLSGLKGKTRSDHGNRRVFIGRTWDAAVPFDEATKARIAEAVLDDVRSLWAANTECGWRWIARMATEELENQTLAAGFDFGARRLRAICALTRCFVEQGRTYRAVAIHDKDRKRWFDRHIPRVLRKRDGRKPMAIVVGDVHHVDVLLRRAGGSTFTPKLVAWHDWATNRLFLYPVFPRKGRLVRRADVIEAYIAMVRDPEWGVPEVLYLDNGGEYNWAELVDDAQRLNTEVRYLGDNNMVDALTLRRSAIVKSLPYNAPAKAIEGLFGVLEGGVLSMLPGWIGGNRMKKKTANIGREPAVYPHSEDAFRRSLAVALAAYETHPQQGVLGGHSPREAFAAAVEGGWQRMDVDPDALRAVFAKTEPRVVNQGVFSVGGVKYTARVLQRLPAGTPIAVRVPLFNDKSQLPVLDRHGQFLCVAEPDRPYDALDPEGAREAARRYREARRGIEDLRSETHPVNLEARLERLVAREAPAPQPPSAGIIRLSDTLHDVGRALSQAPGERSALEEDAEAQKRAAWRAVADDVLEILDESEKLRANG